MTKPLASVIVRRVAAAICCGLDEARSAIEAMREPTDAMVDAAAATPGMKAANDAMLLHQARGYGFTAGAFDAGSPLHQAWRAMIDAALAVPSEASADAQNAPSAHPSGEQTND